MSLQHILKNSSVSGKEPLASQLANGELSINYHADGPFLCCKDTAGNVRRVAGVWVSATAPSTPFPGELWLDTAITPSQLKVYKDTTDAWVFAGEVNTATTTTEGIVRLATNAEAQGGTSTTSAVTPAALQSKISDSTSSTSSTTIASSTAVKAVADTVGAALPKSGGTITGILEIGNAGQLRFEGSSNDAYETTLAVEDPTATRTITLPDRSGTVITTGDTGTVTSTMIADGTIVNADINANAEIAVSKLADGSARQLLQTDAAGTGVEWTSNVDIPGTLDVTGAAVFDSSVAVTGALTKSGNNVVTVGDTGTVVTAMVANDAITYAKIQNVSATDRLLGRSSAGAGDVEEITCTAAGRALLDDVDAAAQRTTLGLGTLATQNGTFSGTSSGTNTGDQTITLTGDVTGSGTGSFAATIASGVVTSDKIADGTIVNADINASAAITGTKISPDFGSQNVATTGDITIGDKIIHADDTNTAIRFPAADIISFENNGSEKLRIDANGRLLIGASTSFTSVGQIPGLFLGTTNQLTGTIGIGQFASTSFGSHLDFIRSDSGVIGQAASGEIPNAGAIGTIRFNGSDGTTFRTGALISANADGQAWANADCPTRLVFSVTADGQSSPTERLRIDSSGTTTLTSATSTAPFIANIGTSEVARIDGGGRLLIGKSTTNNVGNIASVVQVDGSDASSSIALTRRSNDINSTLLMIAKSRSTSSSAVAVQEGDIIGEVRWAADDGVDLNSYAAAIRTRIDGAVAENDLPGRFEILTTASGNASPTERFRITSDGVHAYNQKTLVAVNTTATLTVDDLKTGIITSTTAAAVTMTLPTGTDTEAGFSGIYTGMTFEWSVINTGATNAVTVSGNTGHTLTGSGTVAASTSGRFASRRTGSNTFVTYRLS